MAHSSRSLVCFSGKGDHLLDKCTMFPKFAVHPALDASMVRVDNDSSSANLFPL